MFVSDLADAYLSYMPLLWELPCLVRHGDETLRRFLEEVSEGLPDLILQSAEKRLKAIQQLEENLSTFVEQLRFRNGGVSKTDGGMMEVAFFNELVLFFLYILFVFIVGGDRVYAYIYICKIQCPVAPPHM